jgi:hypothetical protein
VHAAEWLADRGFGRAREIVEFANEPTPADRAARLARLSEEDRATLRAILNKAYAEPEPPALPPGESNPS